MLHGIEHLTYDGEGYIYWKGQHIEHFGPPAPTDDHFKDQCRELAARCQTLENRKQPVNVQTVVWQWDPSGNGDRWEIAFYGCKASPQAQAASKRICQAYGVHGLCDPAYIAHVIQAELDKKKENQGGPHETERREVLPRLRGGV